MTRRGEPMVRWYNPVQLFRTGVDIFVAELLHAHADTRLLEIQSGPEPSFAETEIGEDGLWFDYMADTGDGYVTTHAMASLLSRETLVVGDEELPRGSFLVLGGDAVYPVASREAYERRLKLPFDIASRDVSASSPPHIYAIPGNHDWYDGLISFTRLFTGGSRADEGRRIGLWRTRQSRSYFSIELPGGWWLWGVDIQLRGDVDEPQREFFQNMLEKLGEGDRVIACTPEPDWIQDQDCAHPDLPGRLEVLSNGLAEKSASVPLQLAGDLHNYQRFDANETPYHHKIISGGGGAFLHPTHRLGGVGSKTDGHYSRQKVYPSAPTSFGLSFGCLLLAFWNPTFSALTAIVYVIFSWPLFRVDNLAGFVREGGTSLFLGVMLVLASAFYAYNRKGFRVWGGVPHGLVQVGVAYVVCRAIVDAFGQPDPLTVESLLAVATIAGAGALLMPTILGVYLFTALNLFGFHPNEAFTALRVERYKHFLRCRIAVDGSLTIHVVGLDHPRGEPHLVDEITIPGKRDLPGNAK